jgi:hypothetical protein
MRVGELALPGRRIRCLLNWDDSEQRLRFRLDARSAVRELLGDADLGTLDSGEHSQILPPRSGRVLVCT